MALISHHHTSQTFLTKGSRVEVSSDEDGFSGAWYVATVIRPPPSTSDRNNLVYIEYHNLLADDDSSSNLREYANVAYVRPPPPPDSDTDTNCYSDFELNDVVDAFYRDGWWTGVITSVVDKHNFVVTFKNPPDKLQFHISKLRIHREWVDGKWVPPQNQRTAGLMFTEGKKVEVSFDKESLQDVWFPATILKNSGNDTFLVEYQLPGNGDEAVLDKVTVDYHHIRPSPPHLREKNFVVLEKVDAYSDFGWWSGVITKELADNRYKVFFKQTKEEREFIYSKVRPHMEWKGGKWFNTSQGDSDGITTRSLMDKQIEQSNGKQSTVETSIMKKTKTANLDSNDESLLPSKTSKDKSKINDPSKVQSGTSVGQSEGFDSEASVINDQEFSKSENLSNGKKMRSKRGQGIELNTPVVNSSRKRGRRLANELKDLQTINEEFMKGFTILSPVVNSSRNRPKRDSVKTTTQEINEKSDAAKDVRVPILRGSRGKKKLQKLPSEIPNVAEGDIIQPRASSIPLTPVDKAGNEGDAASVAPKRKRGRPPRLQPVSPETAVTDNNRNVGVDPGKDAEGKQVELVTSSGSKLSEDNQIRPLTKDELQLPTESSQQSLSVRRGGKKKSSRKGKRGKRKTIFINTESPAPVTVSDIDSQDAFEEKADDDSSKKNLEVSLERSLDSDNQPLSRWFEGVQSHGPEGNTEQSSKSSEKRMEIVACFNGEEPLPFAKSTLLWKTLESMEAFQKIPQQPHFRPLLKNVKESNQEGAAIGMMVMFSTVVDKTRGLKFDDPRGEIEDCLETLLELEDNGFNVNVIRERLKGLVGQKDTHDELAEESKRVVEKIEEHCKVLDESSDEEMEEIERQIRELEERKRQVLLKKEKRNLEIGVMKTTAEKIEREMREVNAEFDRLAATPF
ncbi:DUF724 domain-containing protein 7-like [Rutidosis leptorrhynchoides]|uniref:DUF724 domain-containing protein 7-like n=1 Tax=Rutidosis leptorrhynchoides TaxID=125765 RepID=UPI003A99EF1D